MESIGNLLQQARIEKKQSLAKIAQIIHIRENYLDALERDALEELPSPVQARGFLRLYWSYLGLDEDILQQYLKTEEPVVKQTFDSIKLTETRQTTPKKSAIFSAVRAEKKPANAGNEPNSGNPQSSAEPLFLQIGRKLREQRDRLSLTVDNIATYTHISAQYIRAMEAGRMDELPSPVQARGMIQNYATFLDMDTDSLLLQYAEALQIRREETQQALDAQRGNRKPFKISQINHWRSFISLDTILVGILIVGALIALVWGGSSIMAYRQEANRTQTAIPISELIILTSTATLSEEELSLSSTPEPSQTLAVTAFLPPDESTTPGITGTIPTQGIYPVQVFIVALQQAYLQVTVDETVVFNGRVVPGNPYDFSARRQIEVVSGNAAALQIVYNNRNLGSLGATGAVVRLVFGEDDFGTPTYTPTATYTNTPIPSRTPRPSNTYPPTRTPTNTRTPTATRTSTPPPG